MVSQTHSISTTWHGVWFLWDLKFGACWVHKLLPLQRGSRAKYHIEIACLQRNGDVTCITAGIESQIVNFDDVSLSKAICAPILVLFSLFWISLTKLWDMIIRQCMCKGCIGHAEVQGSISRWKMTNQVDIGLPATGKSESNIYITDEMYKQNTSKWFHTSCTMSGQCVIQTQINDNYHAALLRVSNCITLHWDLLYTIENLKIGYHLSWRSRRMSCKRTGREVRLYMLKTSGWIYMP